MQFKKQKLELDMEQQTDSKLGTELIKAVYSHMLIQLICRVHHAKCWAGCSTSWNQDHWRNINNLRYTGATTLMAEREEELRSLLLKVKEESEKNWLKTQHSKNEDDGIWPHHFMENRWRNNGNSSRLYFLRLQNHCR